MRSDRSSHYRGRPPQSSHTCRDSPVDRSAMTIARSARGPRTTVAYPEALPVQRYRRKPPNMRPFGHDPFGSALKIPHEYGRHAGANRKIRQRLSIACDAQMTQQEGTSCEPLRRAAARPLDGSSGSDQIFMSVWLLTNTSRPAGAIGKLAHSVPRVRGSSSPIISNVRVKARSRPKSNRHVWVATRRQNCNRSRCRRILFFLCQPE